MADLAKLVVRLEAESSKLTNELEKANRKLSSFENSTNKAFAAMKAGVVGLASALSVDFFATALKSSLEFADSVAKTADKIGLTTTALQELRFAAERTGVSSDTLDMAMQRFARRVGEAANGTGELKSTLEQYNIAVLDSSGNMRPLENILNDYANTVAGTTSNQEQLRLAFKAFDSEGAALVNTLRGGAQGLNDLRAAAQQAGVVIEDSLLRKAESINDRWDELVDTIGNKFKTALISAADASLNFFGIYNDLESATDALADAQLNLAEALDRVENSNGRNRKSAKLAAEQAQRDIDSINEQIDAYNRMKNARDALLNSQTPSFEPSAGNTNTTKSVSSAQSEDEASHIKAREAYTKYLADRVEATRVSLLTETELENERFQQAYDDLQAAQELGIDSKQSYWELEQGLLQDHVDKLAEIYEKSQKKQLDIWESGWVGKFLIMNDVLGLMSSLMNTESRKMFEIGKAAATSQAIIDTIASAQAAFKAMAGIPYVGPALGAAAAAAALAAGYARVNAIQSTQFGSSSGSSSVASISGSAQSSAPAVTDQPVLGEQNDTPQVSITFVGDNYGFDDFEETVVNTVRDAISDKDTVIIRSESRQAQELLA